MTKYNSLLATAVAGLKENTREARRLLYERARAAQLKLLEGRNPPLSETEILRERQALEQTIFKIEATATQRTREAPQKQPSVQVFSGGARVEPSPETPSANSKPGGLVRHARDRQHNRIPAGPARDEKRRAVPLANKPVPELRSSRPPLPLDRAQDPTPAYQEWSTFHWTPEQIEAAVVPARHREDLAALPVSRAGAEPEQTSNGGSNAALDQEHGTEDPTPPVPPSEKTLPNLASEEEITSVLRSLGQRSADRLKSARIEEPVAAALEQAGSTVTRVQREAPRSEQTGDRKADPQADRGHGGPRDMTTDEPATAGGRAPQHRLKGMIEALDLSLGTPFPTSVVLEPAGDRKRVPLPTESVPASCDQRSVDDWKPELMERATAVPRGGEPRATASEQQVKLEERRSSDRGRDTRAGQRDGAPAAIASDDLATRGRTIHPRLEAIVQAARYHGVDLDVSEFRHEAGDSVPSATALSLWAQNAGMWSRAVRIRWRNLLRLNDAGPVVLLFTDGSAGLLTGADAEQMVVFLKDPFAAAGAAPIAVDELRLSQVWAGEVVLIRPTRTALTADAQFNLPWLVELVLQERRSLRDIGLASLTISFLTIFPPLLVMTMVNKVLQFNSVSTLALLSVVMVVVVAYEALLGYARRLIISVVGARLDAKINLHLFNRLLRLPLEYFERHPAGETMYRIAQVYRVREFLTGRLLSTFLDLITLCVLVPLLFYMNMTLAWMVLVCAVVIGLIILAYLRPLRAMYSKVAAAETWKSAALGESIVGIKTVKALALEPQRRALWDERIAEAGKWRLAFARLANWPQTLVTPVERLMVLGTMMLGAYMAMNDPSGYMVGGLFAFLMLSQRVAQPLVSLARLVEDFEEVGAAIGEAGSVLNRPLEVDAGSSGLRPKFSGAIAFQDVTFAYAGTQVPALDRVSFEIAAGTMLGIVGRSGSGKSTITRLLQGINRDYRGFVKIDGSDLREINLRHLRQSFGVVLQNNFLFRGSIRENIIAGRPGLTLADAVRAARLAGAEEFIERMPNGYDTYVEEGSPNLSGGQTQRLAIARALIHDPRILLLDEATSALDPESEALVSANLLRIARGRTMIIVSHRLSSLTECDQILVMDQGKLIDMAPHNVLLDRCPLYRQLWVQQNRHAESQGAQRHAVATPRLVPGA
jgi:ATP-binding cassette, subfamily B, bacterial HlyB/CyaB